MFTDDVIHNRKSLKELDSYLEKTSTSATGLGSAFAATAKNIALNVGVMLAVTLVIKGITSAFDKANVTFAEQKEKVDSLSDGYNKLKAEADVLKEKDGLTDGEKQRLDYLERRLALEEKILATENKKLAESEIAGKGDIFSDGIIGESSVSKAKFMQVNTDSKVDLQSLDSLRAKIESLDKTSANYNSTVKQLTKQEETLIDKLNTSKNKLDELELQYINYANIIQRYLDAGVFDNDDEQKRKMQAFVNEYNAMADNIEQRKIEIALEIGDSDFIYQSDAFKKVEQDLKDLAEQGKLTSDVLADNKYEDLISLMKLFGVTVEDLISKLGDVGESSETEISPLVRSIEEYEEALSGLPSKLAGLEEVQDKLNDKYSYSYDEIEKLKAQYPELENAIYRTADGWSIEKDAVNELYVATGDLGNQYANVQAQMTAALNSDMANRLRNLGIELEGIKSIADAYAAIANVGKNALNNLGIGLKSTGTLLDKINSPMADSFNQAVGSALVGEKESNFLVGLGSAVEEVEKQQAKLKNLTSGRVSGGKASGGSPKSSSKGSGSSSEKEAYQAEIDAYKKLQAELENIKAQISANEKKSNNTKDEKEKIALLQQRISLTQKEQSALHNLNNARDEGISKNVELLRQRGFLVDYDPNSNELEIENLEHLNDLKGANQEKTNDLIKEYEELIKYTESLNDENKKASESWWDSYYNLSKYKDEIEDLNRSIFDDKINDLDFSTIYYDGIVGQEDKIINIYKDIIAEVQTELNRAYAQGLTVNDNYIQDLLKQKKDYVDKVRSLNQQIYDNELANNNHILGLLSKREGTERQQIEKRREMQKDALKRRQELIDDDYALHVDEIRKLENEWIEYYDNILGLQKKQLEAQKDILDSTLSAVTSTLDDEISRLQEEKNALSDVNDERERKLKLQELESNLEKAKSQKTSYIYRENRGFDYEVDEDAIKDAQNALDDYNAEQAIKNKEDSIQKEIDALQKYKEQWDNITNAVTDAQNEQKAAMELGSGWKQKVLDKDSSALDSFKTDYTENEKAMNVITTEMADHVSDEFTRISTAFEETAKAFQNLIEIMGAELPVSISPKTYYANEDGSAPSDAGVGDTVKTGGGTYQITKPNEEGSSYNESTGRWSKKIDDTSVVIDKLNAGTVENTTALKDNTSNVQTSSNMTKDNTGSTKENSTSLGTNSTSVDSNTKTVNNNSSSVDSNSSTVSENTSYVSENSTRIGELINALDRASEKIAQAAEATLEAADRAEKAADRAENARSEKVTGDHVGGIIGSSKERHNKLHDLSELKPDEKVRVLQDGEGVFTENQMDNIIERIDTPYMLQSSLTPDALKGIVPIASNFNIPTYKMPDFSNIQQKESIIKQEFNINKVELPNIKTADGIPEMFNGLDKKAIQWVNSSKNRY